MIDNKKTLFTLFETDRKGGRAARKTWFNRSDIPYPSPQCLLINRGPNKAEVKGGPSVGTGQDHRDNRYIPVDRLYKEAKHI